MQKKGRIPLAVEKGCNTLPGSCLVILVEQIENAQLKYGIFYGCGTKIIDITDAEIIPSVNTETRTAEKTKAKRPGKIRAFEIIGSENTGFGAVHLVGYTGQETNLRTGLQAETIVEV